MTKEDLLYEWNINRLKKHELSLFWEMVDDPRITIEIRRVSGAVIVSGETDKHLVGEWLRENIEQAIYWSKRSFMKKGSDNEWHLKEYSKSEPHVANGRHITHIFKDEFIGDATFLKEAAAAGKEGNDCGEKYSAVFSLSCITPYTEKSIINFMRFSGLDIYKTRMILKEYSRLGIDDLKDVNLMLLLGHANYDKYK